MTLGFSQQFKDGTPTHFVEKILTGLERNFRDNKLIHRVCDIPFSLTDELLSKGIIQEGWARFEPKLHTIREDAHDRWYAGIDIHFVINNRTKKRFQFAPVVKCVSVQDIEIIHSKFNGDRGYDKGIWVKIDDIIISDFWLHELVIKDGFKDEEQFFNFFNKDFTGKLIHWTDLKY